MPLYRITRTTHLCRCDGQLILLDLKRERYVALNVEEAAALAPFVQGWPVGSHSVHDSSATGESGQRLLVSLLERRLLTKDPAGGKHATPPPFAKATRVLVLATERMYCRIRISHVLAFLSAAVAAKIMLRFIPLRHIVAYVGWRKRRSVARRPVWHGSRVDELVGIFFRLRPFAFSGRDACLLRSLALVEFLARHRVYPDWVFAVQSVPFGAHSWVQYQGVALNDYVRRIREFTPILVV